MLEMFAIGTIGFNVLFSLLFVVFLLIAKFVDEFTSEYDDAERSCSAAFAYTVVLFLLLWFLKVFKGVPTLIISNWQTSIVVLLCYFVIGIFFSVFKWFLLMFNLRNDYILGKKNFLADRGIDESSNNPLIPDELKKDWKNECYKYCGHASIGFVKGSITASSNKPRIVFWIGWWPISLVWTLINDPLRKIANFIFDRCKRIYEDICSKLNKDLRDDMNCKNF